MSSSRPVYIPSRKRKQKQPRFHGAFTGGFAAGHFNTVADGSAEGFVPKQDESDIRRQQKPEDFMDDQDHNEWGGPTSVKEEYAIAAAAPNINSTESRNAMVDLVKPPAQNVGHRLLRILGWRDGSTAYVPREEKETVLLTSSTGDSSSIESLLSSKRLKRIQLQQARVKLPPPKLDTCGLGYDSYENAPEFRAHRERRRKEAQKRAKAVTASSAENRNVYRLSNLLDDNDDTRQSHPINHHEEEDDPLVSYETEQSFVGTKTVGGFALREDDDDVYDDHVKASKSNRDEYDTVVYEHASEDENDDNSKRNDTGQDLGSVFASWATSRDEKGSKSSRGVTSDGRPPLPGFVLGSSTTCTKAIERYPGPDLPSGYEPKRHEFANDEYPSELKEETKALQKSLLDERRKTIQQERKTEIRKMEEKRESGPMASAAFAGLAAAMKNRFTPSAPEPPATLNGQPAAIGLHRPSKDPANTSVPPEPVFLPKPIIITRTTMTFVPESLLCKRFHVPAPAHAKPTVGGKSVAEPKGEAAYFEKEIMSKATVTGSDVSKAKKPESKKKATSLALTQDLFDNDGETQENDATEKRPSMKVLESIFEPDSESSDSEEEVETLEAVTTRFSDQISSASIHGETAATPSGIPDVAVAPVESTFTSQENEQEDSVRKSEIRKDRRRRKRRSRSRSPSASSSSDRSKRKRSRKREEKKKRKKRHKSSRRRSRDNE